jgi:hypothetical protein
VGKRVDREAIESSGAVTSAFIDRTVELAAALEGDAAALVDALRDKAIPRFREGSIDALENHLEQHGYLDRRATLEPLEIHTRVLAALSAEIRNGEIAPEEVESLLQRLFAGMGEGRSGAAEFLVAGGADEQKAERPGSGGVEEQGAKSPAADLEDEPKAGSPGADGEEAQGVESPADSGSHTPAGTGGARGEGTGESTDPFDAVQPSRGSVTSSRELDLGL